MSHFFCIEVDGWLFDIAHNGQSVGFTVTSHAAQISTEIPMTVWDNLIQFYKSWQSENLWKDPEFQPMEYIKASSGEWQFWASTKIWAKGKYKKHRSIGIRHQEDLKPRRRMSQQFVMFIKPEHFEECIRQFEKNFKQGAA